MLLSFVPAYLGLIQNVYGVKVNLSGLVGWVGYLYIYVFIYVCMYEVLSLA